MLKEQSQFIQRSLFAADLLIIALSWLAAYYVRFVLLHSASTLPGAGLLSGLGIPVKNALDAPPYWVYLRILPAVLILWGATFQISGLYDPRRIQRLPSLIYGVAKAIFFGMIAVLAALFFYRTFSFSRVHMLLFGLLTPLIMVLLRVAVYGRVRRARLRGENVRRVLIVGAGKAGRRLQAAFEQYPWMGVELVGFLDDNKGGDSDVLGPTTMAAELVDQFYAEGTPIDYVYIALPLSAVAHVEDLLNQLSVRLAHVYLVPDLFQFDIINSRVTDVDGMPVIHIIDEAPLDLRHYVKRSVDIILSAAFLLVISPILIILAAGVKISSPGPVFYRQERMSLNGHRFYMLKFRSMPVNAEAWSGPVWARPGEDRATPFGRFLRRTSLDELPQFINVLLGDMSIVGPRPERPVFIEEFSRRVPRYMLRHKMRSGITGWAQVNGWRGNTSIEKRIECDLFYIQNWSLKLDFKIMWMTLWKGLVNENAY